MAVTIPVLPTTPVVSVVPPAPQRKDGKTAFNLLADPFLAALPPLGVQINQAVTWIIAAIAVCAAYALTAGQAATAALASADAAAQAVTTTQGYRDAAKAYKEAAEAVAAAIGSAAGLPSLVGKAGRPLVVNAAGTAVEWGTIVTMDATQTGAFRAIVGHSYWLGTTVTTVSLPLKAGLAVGATVEFSKSLLVTPIIQTTDGALIKGPKKSDTSVSYNLDANITFIFNGTDWEV